MLQKIGHILGGDPHKRELLKLSEIVAQINDLEPVFENLSDDDLRSKTEEYRNRLKEGETLDDLLLEAFAAVREASKRTLGLRPYDVQLIGGIALNNNKIAEMRTGEGKTLVATAPLYLNALSGQGAHLVTVNDYLARRDARWMAPIYHALGMSVGVLQMANRTEDGRNAFLVDLTQVSNSEDQHQLKRVQRREAYQADITYGTNSEFGFDYLRDNLTMRLEDRVQRGHNFVIVDEVDNILIDEARTPLIISGPASEETEWYVKTSQIVRQLTPEHYEINEHDRTVTLTEIGEVRVEELLGTPLGDPDRPEDINPEQARLLGYLEQSLRAQFLYRRNKDYLVQGGKVIIVDEFTGRLMPGRRWSEGLHQAVEAKEGVKIEPENVTYATITLQNYFRMYKKLSGMTGTAATEAEEFFKIYKLDVVQIPTNLEYVASLTNADLIDVNDRDQQGYHFTYYARRDDPERIPVYWKRKDFPDVVYRSEEAKLRAITQEIMRYHIMGRPQLVGTTSVEHSDRLSDRLDTEAVRRLSQIILIRQTWMEQNRISMIERAIPELQPLNKPLKDIETSELRQLARQLNISLNPEDPANQEKLTEIHNLSLEDQPRLIKILQSGIPHQVLNARKHDEESQIIAHAGAFGAVTIATNMAGRGVDIKLGGEFPEEKIADVIRVLAHADIENPYDMRNEARRQALLIIPLEQYGIYEESIKAFLQYMDEMERVRELGGLHVIGSERHEARRIDNQLRGRAARQGDPGSSRFYLSLEDDLMRIFGGQQADGLFKRFNVDENLPIEHNLLGKLVEQSQERVEGSNFDVRKHLLEYDDVLNSQRNRIYSQRDRVFTKEDLIDDVLDMLQTELKHRIPQSLKDAEGPWKLLAYLEEIQPTIDYEDVIYPSYPIRLLLDELKRMIGEGNKLADLRTALLQLATHAFEVEREHLERSTQELLEHSEETLDQQIQERTEILDNFIDTIENRDENEEPLRPSELLNDLSTQLRLPLRLSTEQQRRLVEADKDVIELIRQQIENTLINLIINRVVGALERRLVSGFEQRPVQLSGVLWKETADQLFSFFGNELDRRAAQFLGDQGQIARDLDNTLDRVHPDEIDDRQLIKLLQVVSTGSRMVFERRTHRQGRMQYNRLNFTFLSARLFEGGSSEAVTQDILDHLNQALQALQTAWGIMELKRLTQNEITLNQLDQRIKEQLIELLSEQHYEDIATKPIIQFLPEDRQVITKILGKRMQNEVLRFLLLRVISDQWVDYLTRIEALRVSIGLEAYAQRDPLVMYKSRATDMFQTLLGDIRMGVISRMFTYRPQRKTTTETVVEREERPEEEKTARPSQAVIESESGKSKRKRHRH